MYSHSGNPPKPTDTTNHEESLAGVRLSGVTKRYGAGITVLDNIDLEVHDREFMVLVGPSGCGKSTVLRVLSGLEPVDAGEIRIGDRVVNDLAPRDRDIAMVFQSYALYPHLTVFENIAFGLRVRKTPKQELARLVGEAAEVLSLSDKLEKLPRHLSGGERQRVALGRAIVRKPQVFLFDEPLSNLDAKLRVQMRAEISALHKRLQITTIYVTHDQVEAMTMGERITVLNGGHIQQTDEPLTLYNTPANRFVAEFIGSPPMNLMSLTKKDGVFQYAGHPLPFTGNTGAAEPSLDTVLAGIRPEHVDVAEGGGGLPAQVVLVEPMGGETIVYLALEDGTRLVAKIDGMRRFTLGETLMVTFDHQQIHWFDPRTERRISL